MCERQLTRGLTGQRTIPYGAYEATRLSIDTIPTLVELYPLLVDNDPTFVEVLVDTWPCMPDSNPNLTNPA